MNPDWARTIPAEWQEPTHASTVRNNYRAQGIAHERERILTIVKTYAPEVFDNLEAMIRGRDEA